MNTERTLGRLEGTHTVESAARALNVSHRTAINYISALRKEGYVKTGQTSQKKRIYSISRKNQIMGMSYVDIINNISPVKIVESDIYRIHGRTPTLEETLIYAIKTKRLRVVLAALALFKRIKNWTLLGKLARGNHSQRIVGALYDVSRQNIKTRRMSKKFRNSALPKKKDRFIDIIDKLQSKDFQTIEKTWKVHLPFNQADLEDYGKYH